ncbi:MAG: hypothetical protein ACK6B2_13815 [Planctomycetota bacterium]
MQSTRWIECGPGFIELHPEPGCNCDPLRAVFRFTYHRNQAIVTAAGK